MNSINATLEDYRRIKTRATWQIILEIPEENFPEVMGILGTPNSGESIWVKVERIEKLPPYLENNQ